MSYKQFSARQDAISAAQATPANDVESSAAKADKPAAAPAKAAPPSKS
jgi:hypothetical protein